ncbi:Radical SAM domain protein [Chlorobaculum parvum NCIB 8327]|uniref:Radical SAM domain protein n=2 Tax=Chlorobaculum parvum TaxID=274539 RepID=B3QMX1_CHLP8|nr:Radical SAM domain protein [Chlorobaculum parvum NCIB 8327]
MHWRYFIFGRGRGLAKMLPLNTPNKVHVDPASGCNFKCFFCPQSDLESLKLAGFKTGVMKLELFKKMINDFVWFPNKIDELVLGNYGELLLNKDISEMIEYAVSSKSVREVSLITNAALLDKEIGEKIALAGLHKIRISIEGLSDEAYKNTVNVNVSFDKIVKNITDFYKSVRRYGNKTFIYVKIIDIGLTPEDKRKFFNVFSPISDSVGIENLMPVTEKAEKLIGDKKRGMTGVSISEGRFVCPSPFYSLSVHVNGDVGVCCSDWHHQTNIGSIKNSTMQEIWRGSELNKFRLAHLQNSWRSVDACSGCIMVDHYPPYEDIDHIRDNLQKHYQ